MNSQFILWYAILQPIYQGPYKGPYQFKARDQWLIEKSDASFLLMDEEIQHIGIDKGESM